MESAFFAFSELDDAGFEAHRLAAVQTVFCLNERIHPHLAAEFLRLEGVWAFTAHDEAFARAAFRAALTLEPQHRLPTTLAPPGGPLHALYTSAATLPVIPWELPTGPFETYVNGIPSTTAPNGIAVVQFILPDGSLPFSGVVTRREDLPADLLERLLREPSRDEGRASGPNPPPAVDRPRRRWGFAVAPALIAGGLYGASAWSRIRYDRAPTAARRQQTNGLYYAAVGAGGLSLVVGVAVMAPRRSP